MLELEKKLKQRAGRQDLVERNILPPLSLPTASKLFTNSQQLQRAKIADNLQKKMRNRPGRDNLLQMNILPDLQVNVDPALQAKQLQLRKIKLADQLNDKLANRPGPLELLKDGIIEPQLSQVVKRCDLDDASPPNESPTVSMAGPDYLPTSSMGGNHLLNIALPSTANFNRQLGGRHSIASSTPSADLVMDTSPCSAEGPRGRAPFGAEGRKFSDSSISPAASPQSMDGAKSPEKSPRGFNSSYPPPMFKPVLSPGMMTTSGKSTSSPGNIRKKQQKKYRKLRYHEYVPPSKSTPKGGKTNPKPPSKSDTPYSSILLQQQLFLQFQVLQQQYPNGVLMQKIPDLINSLNKEQKSMAVAASKGRMTSSSPPECAIAKTLTMPQFVRVEMPNKYNMASVRFEDLKVSDLKAACKEMGMIISGKKAELVERLTDHNKGLLPAMALPENLVKESRRQAFSVGQCSLDSQMSNSTLSPSSPTSSPIFQFPSEQGVTDASGAVVGGAGRATASHAQLAELHKEYNEIFERQKRNYICQKSLSVEKSIAPRPELSELLNLKLPSTSSGPPSPPPLPPVIGQQRQKGNSLPRGQALGSNSVEPRGHLSVAEKISRSLPSSPKPGSPQQSTNQNSEMMDSGSGSIDLEGKVSSSSTASTLSSISQITSSLTGISTAAGDSNVATGGLMAFSNSMDQLGSTAPGTSGRMGLNTSYYQQLQTPALIQAQNSASRPGRTSLPAVPSGLHGAAVPPSMGPPSYNSVMRSRSIAGMHPNLGSLTGQLPLNNGLSYGADVRGVSTPPNEMASKSIHQDMYNTSDPMEVSMDTGGDISEIFDLLKSDDFSHSASLPMLMSDGSSHPHPAHTNSSHPHTPQYSTSPTKLTPGMHHDLSSTSPSSSMTHQASNPMLSTFLPFGNPPLSSQQKSGSDICLSLPEGTRDGQKNSVEGTVPPYASFNVGNNDLNWLDLDNTGTMRLSPTLNHTFGSLANSHSNPGSLPHEQFQHAFLDDSMGVGIMGVGQMAKSSNQALNGFGIPPHCTSGGGGEMSFLDTGIMQQSHIYSTMDEEKWQQELGLSRTKV